MKTKFFRKKHPFSKGRMRMMRLALLLLPLLGRGLGGGGALFAQNWNGVTVSGLAVNAGTVTFEVSWDKDHVPSVWSDTVWVFVDYNKNGKMERLPLSAGATLTATSAPGVGKVAPVDGNNQGVWVVGNARTNSSFSATVRLLTSEKDVAGACVYASNYPPVGEYKNKTAEISFTGTPMYTIVLKDNGGSTITRESGSPFSVPAGYTMQSFTDKTGAPGIMKCIPMTGDIDFIVPAVSKNSQASFIVNSMIDAPALITYSWSAPYFNPTTYEGTTFTSTAPAALDTYSITLTVRAEGYCDLVKTKDVEVLDSTAPGSTVTFTAFNPSVSAATSTVWYLVDERVGGNSETYKVKKLQDGHIWMVQDLKFGDCPNSTTNWYTDTSAAATTHTPTVYSGYVGHCRASSQANAGYLYNWPAAMQNSNAYYGSSSNVGCSGTSASTTGTNPGACQGICPSGWHIPTGDSSGEYQALHNAIGGCSTSNDNCWNATSVWEGVKGRACNLYGQIWYAETIAGYFSSTPASINNAYNLKFAPNHTYPGTNDVCKNCGFTVRCVMNY